MTPQELACSEIEKLVKNFKNLPAAQRKGMNEMQTRLGYILPMFRALGWDTSNINEVSPEEKVSRGWVDFSFRLGGIPLRATSQCLHFCFAQAFSNLKQMHSLMPSIQRVSCAPSKLPSHADQLPAFRLGLNLYADLAIYT